MLLFLDTPKRLALRDVESFLEKNEAVLEIGFGRGELVKELLKRGYSVFGTEVSLRMVEELKKELVNNFKVVLNCSEDPNLYRQSFPAIFCFEVIEHLQNPADFLKCLPPGRLFLSTPNIARWWVKLTGRFESWDFPPNHLHRFQLEELREMLEVAGYQEISIRKPALSFNEVLEPIATSITLRLKLRQNTEDYDTMRSGGKKLSKVYKVVRLALFPVLWGVAYLLSRLGYTGKSLYVTAVKE